MKLIPVNGKLIVKRLDPEAKSPGGIFIPDTAKEKPRQGKVLSTCGVNYTDEHNNVREMPCKEGDVVLFAPYAGNDVKLGGDEVLLLDHRDVLAIVKN